jgi:ketosteroid isomerase-like protein
MSHLDAVEIVRAHIEAFRADDVESALSLIDPDIVQDTTRVRGVDGRVVHGHEALVREVRRWMGAFQGYDFDVQSIEQLGPGTVMVMIAERGSGKGSGAPVEQTMVGIYNVLDGKIIRVTGFTSEEEALAAVGLSEARPRRS